MKVVIYARVSTDDKDQNPERQINPCKNYCELHNHQIISEITEYHTGDSDPFYRPKGKEILNIRGVKGIVIFSMDRLTRQHPVKVMRMIDNLKNRDIKVISITEPAFNMESEFSDIIMYIMSWFNNYFLKKLRRDVKSGIERARREGKQIGRTKIKFNKYRAYKLLFNDKKSLSEVSEEMNISRTTLFRFKKGVEKNPDLLYKYKEISKTDVFETKS